MKIKKRKYLFSMAEIREIDYAFNDSVDNNSNDLAYHKRLNKIFDKIKQAREGDNHA